MKQKKLLVFMLLMTLLSSLVLLHFVKKDYDNHLKGHDSMIFGTFDPVVIDKDANEDYAATYLNYKKVNDDYIGTLKFDSGLIDLPVFQSTDNDHYMRLDWQSGEYAAEGSTFLDYRNQLSDQNLIVYGHYVYSGYDPSLSKAFTPLGKLTDEANYRENANLKLYLSDHVREYQVAYVYYCILDENTGYLTTVDDMQYYWTNYSNDYFDIYFNTVENASFYDTGVTIGQSDKFLTLLTCVENHDELRLVVLCKEINRSPY